VSLNQFSLVSPCAQVLSFPLAGQGAVLVSHSCASSVVLPREPKGHCLQLGFSLGRCFLHQFAALVFCSYFQNSGLIRIVAPVSPSVQILLLAVTRRDFPPACISMFCTGAFQIFRFFIFVFIFWQLNLITGLVLERPDLRLQFFVFLSYSYGGFSVTYIRCSVKYA
jgi:hypothetical protein